MTRCEANQFDRHVNFYKSIHGNSVIYQGKRCRAAVTVTLVSGCVHEHLTAWESCAGCAAKALAQVADEKAAKCVPCSMPGDSTHTCPVMLQIREHDPAVTA